MVVPNDAQASRAILKVLDNVLDIAKATPPADNKLSRFGNPAFKDFYDAVGEVSQRSMTALT